MAGIFDTDIFIQDVFDGGFVGVVDTEHGTTFDMQDIDIAKGDVFHFTGFQLKSDFQTIPPSSIPDDTFFHQDTIDNAIVRIVQMRLNRNAIVFNPNEAIFYIYGTATYNVYTVVTRIVGD